jgi:hypothetical protein
MTIEISGPGETLIGPEALEMNLTQAEAIRQIGDLYRRTRLTPTLKRNMVRYLAWRRA